MSSTEMLFTVCMFSLFLNALIPVVFMIVQSRGEKDKEPVKRI